MPKFIANAAVPREIDTDDLTGVRMTLHWVKGIDRSDPENPVPYNHLKCQYLLTDDNHPEGVVDDIMTEDQKTALLASLSAGLNNLLASKSGFKSVV